MIQRMSAHAAESLVVQAQRAGDLIGVRISISEDDNEQDPWTLPPSRKRLERPIEEPLPERVQLVRANLLYVEKRDRRPRCKIGCFVSRRFKTLNCGERPPREMGRG
jgi:hypothetical protein